MSAMRNTILGITLVAVAYPIVYAQDSKTQELGQQGLEIARKLKSLVSEHKTDRCVGDVLAATSYIELAAHELSLSKRAAALTSLAYGYNELNEISSYRTYCSNWSHQIKSYVKQVMIIKQQLEQEPFPEDDIPDSCLRK